MIQLCDTNNCTGCGACFNKCPKHAISMVENEEGFKNPKIDIKLCVECGQCLSVCPQLSTNQLIYPQKVYAGWISDNTIRRDSASGGAFSALALFVLRKKGLVFGAYMDNRHVVKHIKIDSERDLSLLRDSKYVQSNTLDSFIVAKKYLDENRYVLFTGTSCQIAGLMKFLNKQYNNLITVDIICHGVPSPKVFKDYIDWVKNKHEFSVINKIRFRDKFVSNECSNCLIEGVDIWGKPKILRAEFNLQMQQNSD